MSTATQEQLPTMVLKEPPSGLRFDKTKDGWMLAENTPLAGEPTLILSVFLGEGESRVNGEVMLERGKSQNEELGTLAGQLHAERLLDQQGQIPVEWRKYVLICAGTIWLDSDGHRRVPSLGWGEDGWVLDWSWLGRGFARSCRLARLCK